MSQSPQSESGSRGYEDGWRAINLLIRSDGSWSGRERAACYLNQGAAEFQDSSYISGLDSAQDGRSFVPVDLDRDGDLDLIAKYRNGPQLRVFRNELFGKSLRVRAPVIGTRVTVRTDRRSLTRELQAGSAFLSQTGCDLHFGLLPDEELRELEVRLPGKRAKTIQGKWGPGRLVVDSELRHAYEPMKLVPKRVEPSPAAPARETWLARPIPAPSFDLDGIDGRRTLESWNGSPLLVTFWATWCPPCRAELESIERARPQFAAAGLRIAAISVDEPDQTDLVRRFVVDTSLTFPVLFADRETVQAYTLLNRHLFDRRQDLAIPTSFLLNSSGEILKVYRGSVDPSQALADAAAGKGPAVPFDYGRWYAGGPSRSYVEMATTMAERGLTSHARDYLERELASGAPTPELQNNLGALLTRQGDLARAEKLIRAAIVARPRDSAARINLASLQLEKGEPGQAIRTLRSVISLTPDDPSAHDLLGSALFATGAPEEASAEYVRAIELAPQNPAYSQNLGMLLASQRQFQAAASRLQRALDLGADSPRLRSSLGIVYMQTGQSDLALPHFEQAATDEPDNPSHALNLAMYHAQTGDLDQARLLLERLLEDFPDFQPARETLSQLPPRN